MTAVICAVMNREAALRISLASWLQKPEIDEIIITDWSSTPTLECLAGGRVTVIRVNGEVIFHKTAASNLALDYVTSDTVMQLDTDYVLSPYYNIFNLPPPTDFFYCGRASHKNTCVYHQHLTGFLYVKTDHLRDINGYNEYMVDWGYEDDDSFKRLVAAGVKRTVLPFDDNYIFHMLHAEDSRHINRLVKNKHDTRLANKAVSEDMPYPERRFKWRVTQVSPNAYVAEKVS